MANLQVVSAIIIIIMGHVKIHLKSDGQTSVFVPKNSKNESNRRSRRHGTCFKKGFIILTITSRVVRCQMQSDHNIFKDYGTDWTSMQHNNLLSKQ